MKNLAFALFLGFSCLSATLFAQTSPAPTVREQPPLLSLRPADTLHKGRFWTTLGFGTAVYTGTMFGLYHAWYADYPLGRFHAFNDMREWNQMDKMGHWLMSYNEARWVWMGANWVGMKPKTAAWVGFAGGQLVQTSFEIFDGFSEQWGWSWGDVGFNTLGSGLFLAQQLAWGEQRITMKMSAMPVKYPDTKIYAVNEGFENSYTTLKDRADALYGTGPVDLFLKNYNTLAVWMSVNPRSFMAKDADSWWPRWLNVAAGMGANNIFEGFGYEWSETKDCASCPHYRLDPDQFPRTRQFFLSFDVDMTKIRVKNRFLRTLISTANIFKIPAPTLEWRDHGGFKFHAIYF